MNNSYSHYYPQPPAPSYPTPYPPLDPQQPPHFYAQQQPLPSYPAQYAQPMPINHRLLSSSRQLPPSAVSVSIAAPAGPAYNYGHLQQDDIHMHIAPTYLTSHASQEYMSHPTEQQLIIREANVVGALGRADDMSVDTNNTKTKRAKSAKKSEPPKVEKGSFSIAICERGKCGPCLFR